MFDWNHEEITNIKWDEARESDDRLVPYPDGNEEKNSGAFGDQTLKEWKAEALSINLDDQKKSTTGADLLEPKVNECPKYEEDECLEEGLNLESWPSISISSSTKTEQDSKRMGASNNLTEIPEPNASTQGETPRRHGSSEIFQNQLDDEQGDFVNYGWDTIGSFDDLDRIFSNDDPIYGHPSLSNVDELWSSSKDVTSNPEKSLPLSFEAPSLAVGAVPTLSGQLAISSERSPDQDILSPVSVKRTNFTSDTPQNSQTCSKDTEYSEGETKPSKTENTTKEASAVNFLHIHGNPDMSNEFGDKFFSCAQGVQQKRLLRTEARSKEKFEVRQLQDICGTWSTSTNQFQQFDTQYAPAMGQPYPPFQIPQHRQLIGPQSSQYNNFPGPVFGSPLYVDMGTQYPPMVGLPQHRSCESSYQQAISGSDPPAQPLSMTPQEKIEKLRRRQQMRAMLAIQKQQEQFNNHASSAETPTLNGANSEVDEMMPVLPSSEKDDSAIGVHTGDHSVEDSILCHLQHIVGKLDIRIRLCIRDSLFRLAQSAVQRQYGSDTNRSGRDEGLNDGEQHSQNRFSNMPDVETETNQIDRTVAHLLFHRPLDPSEKQAERPGSSSSANLSCEMKADSTSLPITQLPQNLGTDVNVSHDGEKPSLLYNSPDEGAVFRTGTSQ